MPIKRSVTDDYIVCLEDGKKLKMLKRHLMTAYGMTPEAYRAKWGLRPDYPMVAPNYSAQRQALAKQIALGRKPAPAPEPEKPRHRRKASAVARGHRGARRLHYDADRPADQHCDEAPLVRTEPVNCRADP